MFLWANALTATLPKALVVPFKAWADGHYLLLLRQDLQNKVCLGSSELARVAAQRQGRTPGPMGCCFSLFLSSFRRSWSGLPISLDTHMEEYHLFLE